ncbi:hypothetical protein AVEN_174729-1 [Araneus ventricosus]|uniref:Uncharacterized protein n=1 Tax=Araneus ventricosus TaxID=182803 RepID=A0A4Y2BK67_ARAVE|nr:hypothetical protein AVEN_174729-1 [Araneus ventricosus]
MSGIDVEEYLTADDDLMVLKELMKKITHFIFFFLTHDGRPTRQGVRHYKGRRGKRANHSPGRNKEPNPPKQHPFFQQKMIHNHQDGEKFPQNRNTL